MLLKHSSRPYITMHHMDLLVLFFVVVVAVTNGVAIASDALFDVLGLHLTQNPQEGTDT